MNRKLLGLALAVVVAAAVGIMSWRYGTFPTDHSLERNPTRTGTEEAAAQAVAATLDETTDGLADADARPTPARESSLSTGGFVYSSSGEAVEGVTLAMIPRDEEWLAKAALWPDLEWNRLEASSVSTSSSSNGSYELPPIPHVDIAERPVLWVTHPGFVGTWFELERIDGRIQPPARIELEPADRLAVRVIDSDGKPVIGANVIQLPDLLSEDVTAGRSPDTEAKLVFRRSTITDQNGRAVLAPLSGRQWIHAEANGLRSKRWRGRHPAEVTLRLQPTFTVEGAIVPIEGIRLDEGLTVRCSARIGGELFELEQVKTAGARWGPVSLPVLDGQGYVFQLQGGSIAQEEVALTSQSAGAHATVDFHPGPGLQIRARIVDEETHAIPGATVSVHWSIGGRYTKVERTTGADGLARFDNFRPGNLWIRARCAGFAPVLFEGPDVQSPPTEPIVLTLKRAGRITGRCTYRGAPVSDFMMIFWQGHSDSRAKLPIQGSSDGRFVIDEAPLGEVVLLATSDDHPSPPSKKVVVTLDQPIEVDFEFPESLVGRGTVIDGTTREPIKGAELQLYCLYENDDHAQYKMKAWGTPQLTNAEGRFEIVGLQSGQNGVDVTAPGYAMRNLVFLGGDRPVIDMDPIVLFAQQVVRIQLTSREPHDYRLFRADLNGPKYHELQNFSEDGQLVFHEVDPGLYGIRILYPGSTTITTNATVRPGVGLNLEVPIGGRRCTIEITTESGERLPAGAWLRADFPSSTGEYVSHFYFIPENQHVEILSVQPVRTVLQVDTNEQVVLGVQQFDFSSIADGATVPFRIRSTARTFRVVDTTRNPVPNAKVVVSSPGEPGGWSHHLATDANGECVLRGLDLGSALVHVSEPSRGVLPSREIQLGDVGSGPIELVLDPRYSLRVRSMERNAPAPGIEMFATDLAGLSWGLPLAYSASDGLARWANVAAGDFDIRVQQPGYWPTQARIHLSGDDAPFVVQVRRLGGLDVEVRNAYGNPAPAVAIHLFSNEMQTAVSDWIAARQVPAPSNGLVTDESGSVRVRGLPNGEYRWRATSSSGEAREGLIAVPASGVGTLAISMP